LKKKDFDCLQIAAKEHQQSSVLASARAMKGQNVHEARSIRQLQNPAANLMSNRDARLISGLLKSLITERYRFRNSSRS
jgi:hypothetical protein